MGNYTVVDLFSGAGGMSLGFSMAGFKILLGTDKEAVFLETFKKNHPHSSVIHGDITDIKSKTIIEKTGDKKIDVIIGGPPCQGLSVSGPRKFHDPRNKLFLSYVRITGELQPSAFVLENVPGLVGLFNGKIKDSIIKEFNKIGYNVSHKILLAADYGVPQLRKRVFFVGIHNQNKKFNFPIATYFENKTFLGQNKYITCEEALSDLPSLINQKRQEKQGYASSPKNGYQRRMRRGSKYVYNHIAVNHVDKVKKIIGFVPEGGNYKDLPEEYRNTRNFHVAWTRYHSKKPAPTIDTGHRHHFHYKYNRVPTVRENARLQSFPDKFIFYGNQSQQNAQVGNAVPPLMAKAVAEELKKCL